jgi:hypothetical protein
MRFFRASSETYEAARLGLDAIYGHPFRSDPQNPDLITTESCMTPAEFAPKDAQGRCLIAVSEEDAARPEVEAKIAELTAANLAEEIAESQFKPV